MKVLLTGDFCPQDQFNEALNSKEWSALIGRELSKKIDESDLTITNLECSITNSNNPIYKTGPALKGDLKAVHFLKEVGFNLVTLANNHIMDYGVKGLGDTLKALEDNQINYVGAGKNCKTASEWHELNYNGLRLAVLNFAENEWSTNNKFGAGANPIDPTANYRTIQSAKGKVDRVLVICHSGHEMYQLPSPRMKKLFQFYVDMGADAVVNHHPHVISGFEEYKGKPIYYSLGNFLFDSNHRGNDGWNEGMAVELTLDKNTIKHDYFTFDQCKSFSGIAFHDRPKKESLANHINFINKIILDDKSLEKEFNAFCERKRHLYESFIEPYKNKYLHFLRKKGLLPKFIHGGKKRLFYNLIRCESHREILEKILKS